jgi:hypothetical protein
LVVLSRLVFLLVVIQSFGQAIPEGYYQFPIRPGQQNFLAGTVGEIRSSHFHTGIDVKTYGKIGLPIYAVADGYINRVKVATGGYGKALYMKHPNGTFSVYAHLNGFAKPIEEFIMDVQYENESYEVDAFPKEWQFAFEKGDVIGYSGNTGSSSGPHLHFEISDKNHQPIDVLQLGFSEVKDTRPPIVKKIAFTSLDDSARINGFFGRKEYRVARSSSGFRLSDPIHLKGRIGIEMYAYDPMNDVNNKNGVVYTSLFVDDSLYFSEAKDTLNFSKQRNMLVHYNYHARQLGSYRFNRLYLCDGNEHSIYKKINRGINFEKQKMVRIEMTDSYGNTSSLAFELSEEIPTERIAPRYPFEVMENYLHFKSDQSASVSLSPWKPINAYDHSYETNFYTWDLRKGLPKKLFIDGETIETGFVATIPSNQPMTYIQEEFEAEFKYNTLFDTLYLRFEKVLDSAEQMEYFHFKNATDPLRSTTTITLKPELSYDREKARVYSVFGKRTNFIGGEWNEKGISFDTRDFVKYTIKSDTIQPTVTPTFLSQKEIRFKIDDADSGIKSYRAELNGQFLLMKYEPKRKMIWTDTNDPNIPLQGEFTLTVTDNSNNQTIYTNTL